MAGKSGHRVQGSVLNHAATARMIREAGGQWVHITTRATVYGARDLANIIQMAALVHYRPRGSFEAKFELGEIDYEVYARTCEIKET